MTDRRENNVCKDDQHRAGVSFKTVLENLRKNGVKLEETTCYEYESWNNCEYAFAPYNTSEDCLQAK